MTATSASDRYDAARKALTDYEEAEQQRGYTRANYGVVDALRALIEPPAIEEDVQGIVNDIDVRYIVAPHISDDTGSDTRITWAGLNAALVAAVQAGILAAWESWEPENSPGYQSEQTAPAFKPDDEPDEYRHQWERLDNNNDEPFEMQIGASDVLLISPSQARRILEILSSEVDA